MQITPDPAQEINLALDKLRHKTQVFNLFFVWEEGVIKF